jgi:hypothetical protein
MPKKGSKKGVGRPAKAKVTPVKVPEDVDEVKSDAETDDAPPAKKIRKNKPGPASSKIQGNKKTKEKEYEVRKKCIRTDVQYVFHRLTGFSTSVLVVMKNENT